MVSHCLLQNGARNQLEGNILYRIAHILNAVCNVDSLVLFCSFFKPSKCPRRLYPEVCTSRNPSNDKSLFSVFFPKAFCILVVCLLNVA